MLKKGIIYIALLLIYVGCTPEEVVPNEAQVETTFTLKSREAMQGVIYIQEAWLKLDQIQVSGSPQNPAVTHAIPAEDPPFRLTQADSSRVYFSLPFRAYEQLTVDLHLLQDNRDLTYQGHAPQEQPSSPEPPAGNTDDNTGSESGGGETDGNTDQGSNDQQEDEGEGADDQEQDQADSGDDTEDDEGNGEQSGADNDNTDDHGDDEENGDDEGDDGSGSEGNSAEGDDDERGDDDKGDKKKGKGKDKKKHKKDKGKEKGEGHKHGDDGDDNDDDDDDDDRDDEDDDDDDNDDGRVTRNLNDVPDLDQFFRNATPGLVVMARYENNGRIINIVFAATNVPTISLTARQNDSFTLLLSKQNRAEISFDAGQWFQEVTPTDIESGKTQLYQGQEVLFIHRDFNSTLYEKLIARLPASAYLNVEPPAL